MRLWMSGPQLQLVLWTPSLLGSADRPRPVLRCGLVMARSSTDQKGVYYGVEAPSLWKPPPAQLYKLSINQPTNQPTNQPHIWIWPLPPCAASRLPASVSGLEGRLRCSSLNSVFAVTARLRSWSETALKTSTKSINNHHRGVNPRI